MFCVFDTMHDLTTFVSLRARTFIQIRLDAGEERSTTRGRSWATSTFWAFVPGVGMAALSLSVRMVAWKAAKAHTQEFHVFCCMWNSWIFHDLKLEFLVFGAFTRVDYFLLDGLARRGRSFASRHWYSDDWICWPASNNCQGTRLSWSVLTLSFFHVVFLTIGVKRRKCWVSDWYSEDCLFLASV